MPELVTAGRALCISEERNQCLKEDLMVVMVAEEGTSSYKAVPSYLPYYIYDTGSMWQQHMVNQEQEGVGLVLQVLTSSSKFPWVP